MDIDKYDIKKYHVHIDGRSDQYYDGYLSNINPNFEIDVNKLVPNIDFSHNFMIINIYAVLGDGREVMVLSGGSLEPR